MVTTSGLVMGRPNKLTALPLSLLLISSFSIYAEEDNNHCNDADAERGWVHLLSKYPQDQDIRALYSLRSRLCNQVDQGSIGVQDASDRFETARELLKQKWMEQNKKQEDSQADS